MQVRECMTGKPLTAQNDDSIQRVAGVMRECDVGAVPVLNDDELVGILTDRDITIRAAAAGLDLQAHQAEEIMSTELLTISPTTDLAEAADLMADAKVRRLPILESDELVGLVSLGDLAVAAKGQEEICGSVLKQVSEPIGPKCVM